MGPYVDSIVPDEVVPADSTVVIIGGGIIGTFAALTLAGRGIPVVLCEKGYIACEQSSRNWGWCRQAGRDVREMPLIVQSLGLWRDMNRLTDSDTGFRECGVLYVGESESDEARFAAWAEMAKPYDIGTRIVRGAGRAAYLCLWPVCAHRRLCGTATGGAGDRARRSAPRGGHSRSLRRAWHRTQRRPRLGGHYRARAYRLRGRRAGRRGLGPGRGGGPRLGGHSGGGAYRLGGRRAGGGGLVKPFRRKPRHSPAAT